MLFTIKSAVLKEGAYHFPKTVKAIAHKALCTDAVRTLFHNFTYTASTLDMSETDALSLSIGDATPIALDGNTYALRVSESGVYLTAKDENELLRGFMVLLDRILPTDNGAKIECCDILDTPRIGVRMVHLCVFHETELWEVHRFLRAAAVLRFTHVILEFWGMLRYDCLPELGWKEAFTKEEIRPIIEEVRSLGVEVVPMFNHWGHASACRVMHGKHVVLDQNPRLASLFTAEGWCWDIRSEKTRALLREVRAELCELCGDGSYFHIGCDEAYDFTFTKEHMDAITDYINEIGAELEAMGRRVIVWGDMFLTHKPTHSKENAYACNAPSEEAASYLISRLHPRTVVADWQYGAKKAPVETVYDFQNAGLDCIVCSWDRGVPQLQSCITTACDAALFGFMHTTWHTLSQGYPYTAMAAALACGNPSGIDRHHYLTACASILRRVYPALGDYAHTGFSKVDTADLV